MGRGSWISRPLQSRGRRDHIHGNLDGRRRYEPIIRLMRTQIAKLEARTDSPSMSRRPNKHHNGTWCQPRCRARRSSFVLHPSVLGYCHPPLSPKPLRNPKITLPRCERAMSGRVEGEGESWGRISALTGVWGRLVRVKAIDTTELEKRRYSTRWAMFQVSNV